MSEIMFDAKSKEIDVALVMEKEMKVRSSSNSATAEATVAKVGVSDNSSSESTIDEATLDTEEAGVIVEETITDAVPEDAESEDTIEGIVDEAVTEEVVTDGMAEGEVIIEEPMPIMDGGMGGDFVYDEGMYMDPSMETMAEVKDPLLSSWPFVIGISSAVLVVSVFLGVLLARRKIKKGIELYED